MVGKIKRLLSVLVAAAIPGAVIMTSPSLKQVLSSVEVRSLPRPEPHGPFAPAFQEWSFKDGQTPLSVDVWYPRERTEEPLPLLVYLPGWDGSRRNNDLLIKDLVSRGYGVIALDDVGAGAAPGQNVGAFDARTEDSFSQSVRIAEKRLHMMTQRVSNVLNALAARGGRIEDDQAGPVFNLAKVGVLGFSFGGSVAAELRFTDPRVGAAVNMDGWMFGRAREERSPRPYLVFNSDVPADAWVRSPWSESKRVIARFTLDDRKRQLDFAKDDGAYAYIARDSRHEDFADDLFVVSLATFFKTPLRSDAYRISLHHIKCEYIAAFFDTALKGSSRAEFLRAELAPGEVLQWLASLPKELREVPPS